MSGIIWPPTLILTMAHAPYPSFSAETTMVNWRIIWFSKSFFTLKCMVVSGTSSSLAICVKGTLEFSWR